MTLETLINQLAAYRYPNKICKFGFYGIHSHTDGVAVTPREDVPVLDMLTSIDQEITRRADVLKLDSTVYLSPTHYSGWQLTTSLLRFMLSRAQEGDHKGELT